MARSTRSRWRDSRDTVPARRRRRRGHRRDKKRGSTYYPMVVDSQSARRGVRVRLLGAVVAVSVTMACLVFAILSALSTFGATFALAVGLCSLGAAVGLLLSARQEEQVHAFAAQLGSRAGPGGAGREGREGGEHGERRALPEALPLAIQSMSGRRPMESLPCQARVYAPASTAAKPPPAAIGSCTGLDKTDGAI